MCATNLSRACMLKLERVFPVLLCLLVTPLDGYPQASSWKPQKNVELITSAGAGGAQDRTVRLIHKIWTDKRVLESPVTVVNKPGGGGTIAWTYLHQRADDGHYLSMVTVTLLTTHLIGQSRLNYTDFTPISILFSEYVAFAVNADSEIKTGPDLLERLKRDPGSVRIALSSALGNANHIAIAKVMKAVGGDVKKLKIAVFKSNAEVMTTVLGGHVDLGLAPASIVMRHMKSGIRPIGVASPQRLGGAFAAVPTWREQGADAIFANWRGIMGAPEIGPAETSYWEDIYAKLAQTSEWKQDLQKNLWVESYRDSKQSTKYMDTQYQELKTLLAELGLTR